jgi:hypothetical protein
LQQPLIDLSGLDATRARLRISNRPRDRSADTILLATNTNIEASSTPPAIPPKFNSSMQRSVSFKRPQEINKTESFNRAILESKKEKNNENTVIKTKPIENESISQNETANNSSPTESRSRSSSQEHIYDNLDVFKRSKPTVNLPTNEDESSPSPVVVKAREHPSPATRLRPITMHIPAINEKQTTNEFENVFNQLKKRGSIRRIRPMEEPTPEPPPPPPVEETPVLPPSQPENEPIIAIPKPVETTPTLPSPNRRKTVGGVHLQANNKVATDDTKPKPSWIDIAKQKQTKL